MLLSRIQNRETRERRGFTLIEVLVVVAIIVILAGGATMLVLNRLEEAKRSATYTRLKNLEEACGTFKVRFGQYPDNLQQLVDEQYVEQSALQDAWGDPIQGYDSNGAGHRGNKPDLWVDGHGDRITNDF